MQDQKTMSFVLNTRLEELLKQWAAEDDRTISATLRQILERETQRRKQPQKEQPQPAKNREQL